MTKVENDLVNIIELVVNVLEIVLNPEIVEKRI
jgi:hypothetical protein